MAAACWEQCVYLITTIMQSYFLTLHQKIFHYSWDWDLMAAGCGTIRLLLFLNFLTFVLYLKEHKSR